MVMKKIKLLRRKIFIREKDFREIVYPQSFQCGYHRSTFIELSLRDVVKDMSWQILTGKKIMDSIFLSRRELILGNDIIKSLINDSSKELEKFARTYISFLQTSGQLYGATYKNWNWKFEHDSIYIRPRSNVPWDKLGLAILERDCF